MTEAPGADALHDTQQAHAAATAQAEPAPAPTFREALSYWFRLGFVNFGGPAGQIAILHTDLVERRRWVPEPVFLRGLTFTMALPGPEAQQLATYLGWRLHGLKGGIAAGSLFILPAVAVLLLLSWLAVTHGQHPAVAGLLYGVQPVVVAIVAHAVVRVGKRTLHHPAQLGFTALAFLAIAVAGVPFPVVVAMAAVAALLLARRWPHALPVQGSSHETPSPGHRHQPVGSPAKLLRGLARPALTYLALLGALLGSLVALRGPTDVLVVQAVFFTQAAFVTFGGAYAVLTYVADAAVHGFGWLSAQEMVQGLGLAESTPGPLIMVVQHVAFLGAYRAAAPADALTMGVAGALVTTLVTFLPSFLFIFAFAPHLESLTSRPSVQVALGGIMAAVVGVILHLAVFFGSRVVLPVGGLDVYALVVAALCLPLLHKGVPVPALVGLGALTGLVAALSGLGVPPG